jgi:hypothetical protein
VSALSETRVCGTCGTVYLTSQGHARRASWCLILPDGYAEQRWPFLRAQLEPARGRHARPESGWTR